MLDLIWQYIACYWIPFVLGMGVGALMVVFAMASAAFSVSEEMY